MEETERDSSQHFLIESGADGICTLTLNRPEQLNALDWNDVETLDGLLDEIVADRRHRVLILTGSGRGFCAGLDIKSPDPLAQQEEAQVFEAKQAGISAMIVKLKKLPIPVIAAIKGPATGAGLALALASDIRVASGDAVFSSAFIRIGISSCDVGVSYLLPRLVGHGLASEMMLTGNLVKAERAEATGLVNCLAENPVERAKELAADIIRNSPFAVKMTKQVLATSVDAGSIEAAIEMENRNQVITSRTNEAAEALAAFREKRPPNFGT